MIATYESAESTLPMSASADVAEAREMAGELIQMIRRLGPDSVVGTVLKQTVRELRSLELSLSGTVVGPYRIAA